MAESRTETSRVDERVVALLDRLAGPGAAGTLLSRLLDQTQPPQQVAESMAASPAFERLYKTTRTRAIGIEGSKDADPTFVDLGEMQDCLSFEEQFRKHFRPRLGKRADGFEVIFDRLLGLRRDLRIVETGSMRIPGNWEGDGQSTFMFDALVRDRGGLFYSIDATLESIDTARRACSSATQLVFNESVAALRALHRSIPENVNLLYLDSFDFDSNNPLPSAIHHMLELTAASSLIGPGTVVCVDDND